MEYVLVKDTTLSSLGDVIREAKGEIKEYNNVIFDGVVSEDMIDDNLYFWGTDLPTEIITKSSIVYAISSADSGIDLCAMYDTDKIKRMDNIYYAMVANEKVSFNFSNTGTAILEPFQNAQKIGLRFSNSETAKAMIGQTLKIYTNGRSGTNPDAVYTPSEMITEFTEISSNTVPTSSYNLSGDISKIFQNNVWLWFFNKFKNKMTTTDITGLSNAFANSNITEIPFEINCKSGSSFSADSFLSESKVSTPPTLNNYTVQGSGIFSNAKYIVNFPDGYFDAWDFSKVESDAGSSGYGQFNYCNRLRKIPYDFYKHYGKVATTSWNYVWWNLQMQLFSLDELTDMNVQQGAWTSSMLFYQAFYQFVRCKKLTFAVQEDGTPYTATWKGTTLDLTNYFGFAQSESSLTNNGFTTATQIKDDTTYQALKDNEDSWTTNINYSRYNHDSAVETINSLPDTSAYGTNTIKFKSGSGAKTDGGAISTLTDAEIAVATAKGWTVSLVS